MVTMGMLRTVQTDAKVLQKYVAFARIINPLIYWEE